MKRLILLSLTALMAVACTGNDAVIKQSLNNIKDEMVSIQQQVADLKVSMDDLDKKISSNKENINANSAALAELRSELSFISNRFAGKKPGKMNDNMMSNNMSKDGGKVIEKNKDQIIILDDNFTDKGSLYSYAYQLYKNGKYTESSAKFKEFLKMYPKDELSDNAQYWIGEIEYSKKNYTEAAAQFNNLIKMYPEGNKVPDAKLKLGFSYAEMGDQKMAVDALTRVIKDHPGSGAYNHAKKKLAEMGVSVD